MAPGFQSSFIPKGPENQQIFQKQKTSVLSVIIIFLFVATMLLSGGMFFYKGMIKGDIDELKSQLATAGESIDKKSIDEMVRYSQKLDIVKSIVLKHQVVSGFLSSLASSTVSTVSFSEFYYNAQANGSLEVRMKGRTTSYGAIALQESVFTKNKYWNSVSFSNLTLGDQGTVTFEVLVSVDPQIAIYAPDVPVTEAAENQTLSTGDELEGLDDINLDLDNL